MKEFFIGWLKLITISCLFFGALAIIIVPVIVVNNIINDNKISAPISFIWGLLSITFFTNIALRFIYNNHKK